jgi:hypothetical protein
MLWQQTLLRDTITPFRTSVEDLSTIDVQFRIDYACLMLMTSTRVLDWVLEILLRGCHGHDRSKQKPSHGRV